MLDKIKTGLATLRDLWQVVQDTVSVKGSLYVDAFAAVMLVRLTGPLWGQPALTAAEAGLWAATIASFAYTKGGKGPGQA